MVDWRKLAILFECYLTNEYYWKLTMLLGRLTTEFSKRWTEEKHSSCKTPIVRSQDYFT